ncbi:MAG TPA: SOS response-associated peptidase [Bacteroidota bacterium]|nr:SOS response-associated peptidase [Bacteroidota bacterium]
MCGRFTITTDRVDFILKKFHAVPAPGFSGITPRYNAAPAQIVPAIVAKDDGIRYLTDVFWGFVTPWGEEKGSAGYQANIRDDTIARNKFFRSRLLTGRCVLLADGFYEWQKPPGYERLGRGQKLPRGVRKIPHRIMMEDEGPFPLASLWRSVDINAKKMITAGIITTSPNDLVAPIHDRMPVILTDADLSAWLDPGNKNFDALHSLLDPFPSGSMKSYVVSEAVNNNRNDSAECITPVDTA